MTDNVKEFAKTLTHAILQANGNPLFDIEIANLDIKGQVKGTDASGVRHTYIINEYITVYEQKPIIQVEPQEALEALNVLSQDEPVIDEPLVSVPASEVVAENVTITEVPITADDLVTPEIVESKKGRKKRNQTSVE